MRGMFGLVSLLVTVAIVLFLLFGPNGYLSSQGGVLKQGQVATETAAVVAGRTPDQGRVATTTIRVVLDVSSGGKPRGIRVESVEAGGAMQARYGLQQGDLITEIGPLAVRDLITSTAEAYDYLLDAYQRGSPLVVDRNGQKLTLDASQIGKSTTGGNAPGTGVELPGGIAVPGAR